MKHTTVVEPCPFIYPSFMGARDRCIEVADNAFHELSGRWACTERSAYIARIDAGEMPTSAGYAEARAADAKRSSSEEV